MRYFCDDSRHLVCLPYSREKLHAMAADLGIKRCWFHDTYGLAHYDVPKRDVTRVRGLCTVVRARDIVSIIKGTYEPEQEDVARGERD